MESRHLRYFIAVAEHLNFSRAAEKLHMSQPPLSQRIRKLEEEIGVRLFDRSRHNVQLTEGGRVLLEWARTIIGDIERAALSTQRAHRGETGRLVIGFMHSAPYDLLPRLLRRFRHRYPEVQLGLREMSKADQLVALQEGRIDIGLSRPPIIADGLETQTVFREKLVLALPAHHSLARHRTLKLSMLANHPFIGYSREITVLNGVIFHACQMAGFSPQVVQDSAQLHTIVSLVSAGIGVAIVPASAKKIKLDNVVYRETKDLTMRAEIVLAWRRNNPLPVTLEFLNVARGKFSTKKKNFALNARG